MWKQQPENRHRASGNLRHLRKGRNLTKVVANGLRLEPNRTKELGISSSGKISIGENPIPEAGKRKPKRVSVILQTLTSVVGPTRRGKQPRVCPKRNRPNRTERKLQPDPSEMYLARRSTEGGATQDPVSGIARKTKRGGRRQEVSCVYVVRKAGEAREEAREEEHANYNQKPL